MVTQTATEAPVVSEDVQVPAAGPEPKVAPVTELVPEVSTEEIPALPEGEEPAQVAEEGTEAPDDLDDETADALVEAYGDKLFSSKKLQERISRAVQDQVTQQVTERTRSMETQGEVANLIERGRRAVTGLTTLAQNAKAELDKATAGEEFDTKVFEPSAFMGHLSDYGQAIVAEVAGRYDGAIQGAIEYTLTQRLPELTDTQAQEFLGIVQTAQRMEGDPKQRKDAKAFFVGASMSFLFDRAVETGMLMERERAANQSTAAEKIAKSNAIKAATAKIAKDKPLPATPGNIPTSTGPAGGTFNREYYRQLKATDTQKAQDYVNSFAAMQRVPALPTI